MFNKDVLRQLKLYKKEIFFLLLISIISAVLTVALAYGIAFIINAAFLENQNLSDLLLPIELTLGVVVGKAIFIFLQERSARRLGHLVKMNFRKKIIDHMLKLGVSSRAKQGEVVHLLTDGLEHVDEYITRYLPQVIYALLIPLIMAIVMIDSIPWISFILLGTYPLIPFFMILIGKSAEALNRQQWERMNFLSGHFLDVLRGISTLKVFDRSREQINVIARLSGEFRDATLRVLRVAFLSALVLELIGTISTALIAVYTGISLLYGELEFFPAFFVLLLAPEFYLPLRQLGTYFHTGMAGNTAIQGMMNFLSLPILEPASGNEMVDYPVHKIEIKDVSFSYPQMSEPALNQINLTLLRGTKTALVGESGAGKSTLTQLLLRLLSPQSGSILVDGKNLQDFDGSLWRQQISYVSQKPYLFKGTIRENIAFGRPAKFEDIKNAAHLAAADQFIESLPQGYDTVLGEGGKGLSGGERQRLAVARAFLYPTDILILDEAGAHLDVETELLLQKSLSHLMKDKITIIISHRLYNLQEAEQIIVMRDGKIIETGSFFSLCNKEGYFSQLVKVSRGGAHHGVL